MIEEVKKILRDYEAQVRGYSAVYSQSTIEFYLDDYTQQIDALYQQKMRELLSELKFEPEDVHIFDTSYGYNQVRIDCVFINEDTELWQSLKEGYERERGS